MKAVDLFSLGVVLFNTISSGRHPLFQGESVKQILSNNEHFNGLNPDDREFIKSIVGNDYLRLLDSMLQVE